MSENKNRIITVMLVLISVLLFGLYDNHRRNDDITKQLHEIKQHNTEAIERLETISQGLEASTERIRNSSDRIIAVEKRIEFSQEQLTTGEQLNRENQSIFERIKARE